MTVGWVYGASRSEQLSLVGGPSRWRPASRSFLLTLVSMRPPGMVVSMYLGGPQACGRLRGLLQVSVHKVLSSFAYFTQRPQGLY